MNRTWRYVSLVLVLVVILLAACTQASAPAAPSAPKAAEKEAAKPAVKPAESAAKPVEKAAAPAPKVEAKEPPKTEAKPAASQPTPSTIAIGTHPTGTGYNAVGQGVAKVTSDHSPVKVIVKPFAGPNAWMPMVESGELELGVINAMDGGWAYTAGPGYAKASKNLRVVVYGNEIDNAIMAVRADSDIKNIKDLRGKRVASDYGGNTVAKEIVTAALESVGLTWNDVRQVPVADVNSGLKAIRESRADAAFGLSTTTAVGLETDAAIGLRALSPGDLTAEQAENPPKEIVEKMNKRLPAVRIVRLKPQGWLKVDSAMIVYPITVVASAKTSPDAIYQVTKSLFENDKELQPMAAWLKDWKQATMFNANPSMPYQEGAIRYWKEKGKWTPEAEANQKKLLGQ